MQAKRLDADTGVPLGEVRDFVRGLGGHQRTKGVGHDLLFFPRRPMTSSPGPQMGVLIDEKELASLMIRHRVGVRIRDVYEVRKIDENYFVE
jgi:restriction system protein